MNTINHRRPYPAISVSKYRDNKGILSFLRTLRFPHWMLLIYPIFLFAIARQREAAELYTIDTAASLQIGFTALIGLYMLPRILAKKYILKQFLFKRPLIWLFLYFVLAIFSAAWAQRPDYTLYRSFEVLLFFVLIIDALSSLHIDNMVKFQMLFGLSLVIFWQFSMLIYGFSLGLLHNSLVSGAVIYLAFLGLLLSGKRWKITYAIIVLSILMATSSASYLALLFGVGGIIIFSGGRQRFLGFGLIIFTGLLIWMYGFDFIDYIFWGKSDSSIKTASGRIPVWQWVYDNYVVLRPYFGYGFGEGETLARLYNVAGLRMQHMHNAVMGALTNLGFVGLALFFIFLLDNAMLLIKERNFPHRSIFIGCGLAVTMNALSISSLTSPISFGFISNALFFVMIVCILNAMKFPNKHSDKSRPGISKIDKMASIRKM